jgi:hypothetical protein
MTSLSVKNKASNSGLKSSKSKGVDSRDCENDPSPAPLCSSLDASRLLLCRFPAGRSTYFIISVEIEMRFHFFNKIFTFSFPL